MPNKWRSEESRTQPFTAPSEPCLPNVYKENSLGACWALAEGVKIRPHGRRGYSFRSYPARLCLLLWQATQASFDYIFGKYDAPLIESTRRTLQSPIGELG